VGQLFCQSGLRRWPCWRGHSAPQTTYLVGKRLAAHVGANPISIPHPTNLVLSGHKITLYRFNQGSSYYCRGLKSEQGGWVPLAPSLFITIDPGKLNIELSQSCPGAQHRVLGFCGPFAIFLLRSTIITAEIRRKF